MRVREREEDTLVMPYSGRSGFLPELGMGEKEQSEVGVREVYRAGGEGEGMDDRVAIVREVMFREKQFLGGDYDGAEVGRMQIALSGLVEMHHPAAEGFILRLIESEVPVFRGAGVSAASKMTELSDAVIVGLERIMVDDDAAGMRSFAATVLLQFRGNDILDSVIDAIHKHRLLHSTSASLRHRIVELSKTEPRAFEVLKEVLEEGGEVSLRILSEFWRAGEQYRAIPFTPGFRELSQEEVARIIRDELFILPEPGVRVESGNTRDLFEDLELYIYLRAFWDWREDPLYLCAPMAPPPAYEYIKMAREKVQLAFRCFIEGEWRYPDQVLEDESTYEPEGPPYPEEEVLLVHISWDDYSLSARRLYSVVVGASS